MTFGMVLIVYFEISLTLCMLDNFGLFLIFFFKIKFFRKIF